MPGHHPTGRAQFERLVPFHSARTPLIWFVDAPPAGVDFPYPLESGDFALEENGTLWSWNGATWSDASGAAHPNLATHDSLGLSTDAELAAHEGAADPHPTYETSAEAAAKVTAHEVAADPHTTYQKESEKGQVSGYASLDGGGTVPDTELPAGLTRDAEHGDFTPQGHHDEVTLAADANTLLGLTGQQLTLDSQVQKTFLAGPASGVDADPTFRIIADGDVPATHSGSAHHAQSHGNADHTTGIAPADVTKAAAAEGASAAVARSDHKHDISAAAAGESVDIGDSAAEGVATSLARSDHRHSAPAPGAGYPLDVAAAEIDGIATTPARSDHVHAHGSGYLPNAHHNESHGNSVHSGKIGEVPYVSRLVLIKPVPAATANATLDDDDEYDSPWTNESVRVSRWKLRFEANVTGTFELRKNGTAIAGSSVAISAARVSSMKVFDSEQTLVADDTIEVWITSGSEQNVGGSARVYGDQDVVAAVTY